MYSIKQLTSALNELRGTGEWAVIAAAVGCDYGTVARIARGAQIPRGDLMERLSNHLQKQPRRTRKTEAA